jgi:nucleoid-associated protein YgaU
VNRALGAIAASLLAVVSGAAHAASVERSDLAHCAAIEQASSRLACYDALAGRVSAQAPAPPAAGVASAPAAPAAAAAPASAAAAAAPSASASAAAAADPQNFGLSNAQLHIGPQGPNEIAAVVTRLIPDARGGSMLLLDNGQAWTFPEQDPWLMAGNSVTIRRASLGSFLLITKQKRSYRIVRVQ